ncbi:MAG: class IV adenylate cyclase [Phycisphaerae bacterium]|jgi:adenylate cyclase class IV
MRNLEFKAELREPAIAREVCRSLGATLIGTMHQVDTYFRMASGRLKRREIRVDVPPGESPAEPEVEIIFYERPNEVGAKVSRFRIYSEQRAAEVFGREPLPIWLVVKKVRTLYMLDNTRIHLDQVEGLGWFLEFEHLMSRDKPIEEARGEIARLRQVFSMVVGEPIDCGYSDLIAAGLEDGRAT